MKNKTDRMKNMEATETPVGQPVAEKKLFIETYGCQMNVADSEVVASIMQMAILSVKKI